MIENMYMYDYVCMRKYVCVCICDHRQEMMGCWFRQFVTCPSIPGIMKPHECVYIYIYTYVYMYITYMYNVCGMV